MDKNPLKPVVVTPGEPGGIGPDLCLKLARQGHSVPWVAACDPMLMQSRRDTLGLDVEIVPWTSDDSLGEHKAGTLHVWPVAKAANETPGVADPANAEYVLSTLREAVRACQSRRFSALVTGPIQKASINKAGIPFSGHTEYLAELTQCRQPVMMLATTGLRVALLTTHIPLRDIPSLITQERMEQVSTILYQDLQRYFGIEKPRILVCGLNPHAGEEGHCGREEIDILQPVIRRLVKQGMDFIGPLPADTLFTSKYLDNADAVLAMYHDQGLPVLKFKGFGQAINVTLGLPVIRTSVDHGTALDLAGTGLADERSLALALETAMHMAYQVTTHSIAQAIGH